MGQEMTLCLPWRILAKVSTWKPIHWAAFLLAASLLMLFADLWDPARYTVPYLLMAIFTNGSWKLEKLQTESNFIQAEDRHLSFDNRANVSIASRLKAIAPKVTARKPNPYSQGARKSPMARQKKRRPRYRPSGWRAQTEAVRSSAGCC